VALAAANRLLLRAAADHLLPSYPVQLRVVSLMMNDPGGYFGRRAFFCKKFDKHLFVNSQAMSL
jgi:hypothetical protein